MLKDEQGNVITTIPAARLVDFNAWEGATSEAVVTHVKQNIAIKLKQKADADQTVISSMMQGGEMVTDLRLVHHDLEKMYGEHKDTFFKAFLFFNALIMQVAIASSNTWICTKDTKSKDPECGMIYAREKTEEDEL